ncbi:hypothetical protein LJY25_16010 [Hymenobacter sp. BT175]|uniref:hypothetical protein n=1 Tax=Hymenobacter translucens TaxID=2886507 RepID=UPI001D0DD795|nr:hypothetical protein [Hymenobacter translucens]MCC2547954.1 hypothetical protein [Hymenobacter translucens]
MTCLFTVARPRRVRQATRLVPQLFGLLLFLLLTNSARAQAPAFAQAASLNLSGGNGYSYRHGVATDPAGNQYVSATFSGTLVLGGTTLVSAGNGDDVFVAKRSAVTGDWLWAVRVGGSTGDTSFGMAVDADGNALVTGNFTSVASFGTGPTATTLTSAGSNDVFVAKFAAATGACVWAVRAGGSGFDTGTAVAVDASGNALVTGGFAGTVSFGTSPTATVLTAGRSGIFVAKFSAATGACAWAVQARGNSDDLGYGIAADASGNALVTGIFGGTANFSTSPTATALTSVGSYDVFLAKFTAATGACMWAVRAGGSRSDYGYAVAVDAGGNALLTGVFGGTASFGTSPTATNLTSAGSIDVFVAKFAAATGACAWAVGAGGSVEDYGFGLTVDAGGNVLVAGYFQGTASFGTSPTATALNSAGSYDAFTAKFAATTGACEWAVRAGGGGEDFATGVAVDARGNAFISGTFASSASFGNLTLMGRSSGATGYVAVLSGAAVLATGAPLAGTPAFALFPNPARSTCQVRGLPAGARVTVLDALGRPRLNVLADGTGTAFLSLPDGLAPGVYLVRSGARAQRLLVE